MSRRPVPALAPNAAVLGAFSDPRLMGQTFGGASWATWRGVIAATLGEACPPGVDEAAVLGLMARATWPTRPARELWAACGRRSGKTLALSGLLTALACLRDYRGHLGPNERAVYLLLAQDRRGTRTALRYCKGLIERSPLLRPLLIGETRESLSLSNHATIEVHTSNYRAVRGTSLAAALCDEQAFWAVDEHSSSPDVETIAALRPGLVNLPGALLAGASSPHARRGVLWREYRRSRSPDADPDVIVVQGPTVAFNAKIPRRAIEVARQDDPERAASEWDGLFRSDVESYARLEAIEACTSVGVRERPPLPGLHYYGFVDPSGGSVDAMTLSIAHREPSGLVIVDLLREAVPPFAPDVVAGEFCDVLRAYGVSRVVGDRFGGLWPRERFEARGVQYVPSELTKSDIYTSFLPMLNGGTVALLDLPTLRQELLGLERRVARGGRASIDHAPQSHDDRINAVAGAATLATARPVLKVGTMAMPFAW